MNHQICGSSISAANQKSTALVIIGSGAVQPRPSRLHVIKRATRMPLIPIPSSPDSARSKLVLDSSSCLNSPPQAAAKVQIFCSNLVICMQISSNLSVKVGPNPKAYHHVPWPSCVSTRLPSLSMSRWSLRVMITDWQPHNSHRGSHHMAITPLATQHIGNAKSANFWARLTLLDCLGVMPDLHLWHLSCWQLLAVNCWLLRLLRMLRLWLRILRQELLSWNSIQAPTPSWYLMWLVLTH